MRFVDRNLATNSFAHTNQLCYVILLDTQGRI